MRNTGCAAVAVGLTTLALTACGGSHSNAAAGAGGSAARTSAPVTATSPAPQTSQPPTIATVQRIFSDFASSTKGLKGTVSYVDVEQGGTLKLAGSYGSDLDFSRTHSGEFTLTAQTATPVAVNIKAVDTAIYFQGASAAWAHLKDFGPNQSAAQNADLELAAFMLPGIDPLRYVNLMGNATDLAAESPTTLHGQQVFGFTGTAAIDATSTMIAHFSSLEAVNLDKIGTNQLTFEVLLDAQGRLVRASQRITAPGDAIVYTVDVSGYLAAPVTAPIAG